MKMVGYVPLFLCYAKALHGASLLAFKPMPSAMMPLATYSKASFIAPELIDQI